jgi:phenylalanyl-tRNA synthetase beta chain
MNLSRKWLSDFTKISASPKEFEDAMTLSGSKVELTLDPGAEIKNVVLGRVASIERHPDSDHMWVCQIDVGREEPVQIITGAQNVAEGDLLPAALHKSLLPGGKKIEKGKLRGLVSNGMLCSVDELALDAHDFPQMAGVDGILIFTADDVAGFKPGDDIRAVIGADDSIVEFEITNNRPDCLSVIGLAREAAATFDAPLTIPTPRVRAGGGDVNKELQIDIQNPALCPRYTARMVKNIKIAPSPKWLRQRLRAAGVRPINNIVDVTNYVMLECGQPMHAFDYACLDAGKIVVRNAREGETMNTLDGTPRALTPDMLVIADANKAVGVAGVMGGENSEITENTKFAVFESANFNGVSIRKTAMALGMRTDASGRFEKGLDIENTLPAVERACELVELLGAGEVLDGIIDLRAAKPAPTTLKLEPKRINALLGADISVDFMEKTLKSLGFSVDGDIVTVPSWRGDIEHYSDLAEEVARFYGYNVIEPTLFSGGVAAGGLTENQGIERRLGAIVRGLGFSEIYTYSFIGQSDYDKLFMPDDVPDRDSVTILNPLGEDRSIMRATPLPSMLDALSKNRGARNENVRLYEFAKTYLKKGDILPEERTVLTFGAYGNLDFYAMKGAVQSVADYLRLPDVTYRAITHISALHPGRAAAVYSGETYVGLVGQVHPAVARNYGLPESYVAEFEMPETLAARSPEAKYSQLPRYPAVARDIALVCDKSVAVGELTAAIRRAGGALLREAALFDVYEGAQIAPGKKSVAFSLKFRADERTLTDEEADASVAAILAALESELGAVIR